MSEWRWIKGVSKYIKCFISISLMTLYIVHTKSKFRIYVMWVNLTYAKNKNKWKQCTQQHAMIGKEKWSQMKSYYVHMITQNHLVNRFYIFIHFCYELHIIFLTILTRIPDTKYQRPVSSPNKETVIDTQFH